MECGSSSVSSCTHNQDVGVQCRSPTLGYRLVAYSTGGRNYGRVEVMYNQTWGRVCGIGFNSRAAQVVCRHLGLPWTGATGYGRTRYGYGSGPYWLSGVRCTGNENSLTQCVHGRLRRNSCSRYYSASVYCREARATTVRTTVSSVTSRTTPDPSQVYVRLVGRSRYGPNAGRLDVYAGGMWGSVSRYRWSRQDSMVICAMLGYNRTGASYSGTSRYGYPYGSGQIWLESVLCRGTESNIAGCRKGPWGHIDMDTTMTSQSLVVTTLYQTTSSCFWIRQT
ncbi:hypothetical protein ScPMuIL_011590 [Solemya velum]